MSLNNDYLTEEESKRIREIAQEKNIFLYEFGRLCGIQDKGFWSRIMSGKKPIPEHARIQLNTYFKED